MVSVSVTLFLVQALLGGVNLRVVMDVVDNFKEPS